MPTLPMSDKNVNHSPHVVLLGAGASLASFKEGDAYKRILPLMNNFVEVVGLNKLLEKWDSLRSHLNYAYMFTIFGYSAPTTDIDAKELMLSVWKNNKTLELAEVEIIDTKSEKEIIKTWKDFTFSHHYQIHKSFFDSYLARFPRRSCDAFAESSLMCKFLEENKFPKFENIEEMHKWIKPLIEEEEKYEKDKSPFFFKTG